jgi:phospho-N-acetylmuramoyl-pentapeptide-transferase
MLLEFLYPLSKYFFGFNVFKYITFRTGGAIIFSALLTILTGARFINLLKRHSLVQEKKREDIPERHAKKEGTPTMGGILITLSILITILLWGNLRNEYVLFSTLIILLFAGIGLLDDLSKKRRTLGIKGKIKFLLECMVVLICFLYIYYKTDFSTVLNIPFFKKLGTEIGILYFLFAILVIVGSANGVNLTDGLDGLAIGSVITTAGVLLIVSYVTGNVKFASYLLLPYVKNAGELAVVCGAIVGTGLGFLWFNAYPAQVFMGDVGSLSLGAGLGTVAVLSKSEFVLFIAGMVFVIETLSVMIQVISFKLTGKRVFRMTPIHHHFELNGIPESKIIVRFWILSILFGLFALSTLKLR